MLRSCASKDEKRNRYDNRWNPAATVDPRRGAIAVAEAARNLPVWAEPLALTDGLNFGNPEKPEIFRQFNQVVEDE